MSSPIAVDVHFQIIKVILKLDSPKNVVLWTIGWWKKVKVILDDMIEMLIVVLHRVLFFSFILDIRQEIGGRMSLEDEEESPRKRFKIDDFSDPLPSGKGSVLTLSMEESAIKDTHLRHFVIGLQNKSGNDCFINSVIQCLASTPLFSQLMVNQASISRKCT